MVKVRAFAAFELEQVTREWLLTKLAAAIG